ncbi:hypothetical protein [Aurantimonas sp. VKM B-3413]|uniref:hypothetical protein n=1 Tax=Aurantimonas sp. VKM B-3413 TaxID=2779401 RepID=UPI001E637C84|nr:hypothetical protein [Aurantimonas sp. VKM B-3413]MCB8837065.1 hypothetical protein [Aurantimonas sp. VKM B-3413]
MNFSAIVLGSGLAAVMLVAHLHGEPLPAGDTRASSSMIDPMIVGSNKPAQAAAPSGPAKAIRLIDLRSGATCKMANPDNLGDNYRPAPIGPDCAGSPELKSVVQWRSTSDGSLEMADVTGRTVLRFMPGDGVLYESVYPAQTLITIVPARS